ncbi:MAG: polysaccharide chain length determinant protein [Devosia sp.]|uniref:GumC family protein n=1 Tax=Devosia sp. TaxID=1871048 RepID=UPI00262DD5A0|nr:hypothetical protein [Devosia sp.]MDB5540238.1 polysaccharide chain length determinant protein [Devosia sp.]
MWLYRWFLVMVSVISFLIIAGVAVSLPKQYDAWSEVYVDKQVVMAAATQDVSLGGASTTPASVMINPKVLLNDNKLQVTLNKISPETANLSPMQMTNAVSQFRKSITISPIDDDGFIQFHVKDVDPVRAARVAQELTSQFIGMSLNRTQNDLGQTTRFLDGQIETYKGLLADSQQQLANYRQAHPGLILPGGIGGPVAGGEDSVVTIAAPSAGPAAAPAPVMPRTFPEDGRIAALEGQLAEMLTRYTDQHPDVLNTRRELAIQLRSRAASAAAAVTLPAAPTVTAAPIQRMTQVVRRGGGRAAIPADIIAEWGTLLGNDAVLRADYQNLINKQQAARMSEAILGSGKRFEIIRPATVPLVSFMPPRSWLVGGALVVALIIGCAVTFVRAAVSGVLVSPRELEEEFDLPVAATVSWEPAWQTGQVAKVDPRFIPPFLRPRLAYNSNSSTVRLVGNDASS